MFKFGSCGKGREREGGRDREIERGREKERERERYSEREREREGTHPVTTGMVEGNNSESVENSEKKDVEID